MNPILNKKYISHNIIRKYLKNQQKMFVQLVYKHNSVLKLMINFLNLNMLVINHIINLVVYFKLYDNYLKSKHKHSIKE